MTCLKEIGLCLQILFTIPHFNRERNWEDLCIPLKNQQNVHLPITISTSREVNFQLKFLIESFIIKLLMRHIFENVNLINRR